MPRFFVEESAIKEDKITLVGDDAHHISYALRMAVGDELTVTDGKGHAYLCRLDCILSVLLGSQACSFFCGFLVLVPFFKARVKFFN